MKHATVRRDEPTEFGAAEGLDVGNRSNWNSEHRGGRSPGACSVVAASQGLIKTFLRPRRPRGTGVVYGRHGGPLVLSRLNGPNDLVAAHQGGPPPGSARACASSGLAASSVAARVVLRPPRLAPLHPPRRLSLLERAIVPGGPAAAAERAQGRGAPGLARATCATALDILNKA